MKLLDIAHCSKCLNFTPARAWPAALPVPVWQGKLLSGFERQGGVCLELDGDFVTAFTSCHPHLELPELARLYDCIQSLPNFDVDWEKLFAVYRLRWNSNLISTLKTLLQSPPLFQEFVLKKSLSIRDLSSLRALSNISEFAPFLEALAQQSPGKSEAVHLLEWGSECFLMNQSIETLLPSTEEETARWRQRIYGLRFPQSSLQDLSQSQEVKKLPWPKATQAAWVRRGDATGLEVRFFSPNAKDLQAKLQGLSRIESLLSEESHPLWKI